MLASAPLRWGFRQPYHLAQTQGTPLDPRVSGTNGTPRLRPSQFYVEPNCPRNARSSRQTARASLTHSVSMASTETRGVLFVCLGNICRSPTAEAVFTRAVGDRGLTSQFKIDSAGTIDYHEGDRADARMRAAAAKRGVRLTSISRPIRPTDFEDFEIILAMDNKNYRDITHAHQRWASQGHSLPPNSLDKVKLMCSFCRKYSTKEVPDPYYGGPEGFEQVLDLLEDACGGLLDSLHQ